MNFFINAVSENGILILFDDDRNIVFSEEIKILWNESSKLIGIIDSFLMKHWIEYQTINNYVVVNWPWSFTWIRTIVLAINTLNFIYKKNITPISYFDLYDNYPIVKPSSRRDSFVKYTKSDIIEIVPNTDFNNYVSENISSLDSIYWECRKELFSWDLENIQLMNDIDYKEVLLGIVFKNNNFIEASYIKKPNIS